jgi:hypothetical protein
LNVHRSEYEYLFFKYSEETLKKDEAEKIKKIKAEYERISFLSQFEETKDV